MLEILCVVNIGIVPPIFPPGIKVIITSSKLGNLHRFFETKTIFTTSHINNLFDKWVNKFDLDEAPAKVEEKYKSFI